MAAFAFLLVVPLLPCRLCSPPSYMLVRDDKIHTMEMREEPLRQKVLQSRQLVEDMEQKHIDAMKLLEDKELIAKTLRIRIHTQDTEISKLKARLQARERNISVFVTQLARIVQEKPPEQWQRGAPRGRGGSAGTPHRRGSELLRGSWDRAVRWLCVRRSVVGPPSPRVITTAVASSHTIVTLVLLPGLQGSSNCTQRRWSPTLHPQTCTRTPAPRRPRRVNARQSWRRSCGSGTR